MTSHHATIQALDAALDLAARLHGECEIGAVDCNECCALDDLRLRADTAREDLYPRVTVDRPERGPVSWADQWDAQTGGRGR